MSPPAPPPEGFAHAHADVNGVRLHYVIGGSGPAIVLLHGWPFSWIEWRAVMPLLVEQGFAVIAPDLRGSGDSSIPAGHWTKRDEAEDVHQLLEGSTAHLLIRTPRRTATTRNGAAVERFGRRYLSTGGSLKLIKGSVAGIRAA
ncbi:alpha/beta fold hydrolase [Streptomyces sp. 11-1-2]|uniref:alpha/beta fold hydrolase n=1 Tax=unclassified Streptomyces TaxID=2593676 RepID=UPI000B8D2E73|nr:alpha/beta fold hydrolase [Streptomyces sp. 11-1-2]ASQ98264.1 hypothetical protein CGL27_39270 [Streptomyces sp. 11-1-2]